MNNIHIAVIESTIHHNTLVSRIAPNPQVLVCNKFVYLMAVIHSFAILNHNIVKGVWNLYILEENLDNKFATIFSN